jgi:uncharacterized protein YjbI with pentapeptide repeats
MDVIDISKEEFISIVENSEHPRIEKINSYLHIRSYEFKDMVFNGGDIKSYFENFVFENCKFTHVQFPKDLKYMGDCRFINCEFSMCSFDTIKFNGVSFEERTSFTNCEFDFCEFYNQCNITSRFDLCRLNGVSIKDSFTSPIFNNCEVSLILGGKVPIAHPIFAASKVAILFDNADSKLIKAYFEQSYVNIKSSGSYTGNLKDQLIDCYSCLSVLPEDKEIRNVIASLEGVEYETACDNRDEYLKIK